MEHIIIGVIKTPKYDDLTLAEVKDRLASAKRRFESAARALEVVQDEFNKARDAYDEIKASINF